jgi:hypothetical protein
VENVVPLLANSAQVLSRYLIEPKRALVIFNTFDRFV